MYLTLQSRSTEDTTELCADYNDEIRRMLATERLLVFNARQDRKRLYASLSGKKAYQKECLKRNKTKPFWGYAGQVRSFLKEAVRTQKLRAVVASFLLGYG